MLMIQQFPIIFHFIGYILLFMIFLMMLWCTISVLVKLHFYKKQLSIVSRYDNILNIIRLKYYNLLTTYRYKKSAKYIIKNDGKCGDLKCCYCVCKSLNEKQFFPNSACYDSIGKRVLICKEFLSTNKNPYK